MGFAAEEGGDVVLKADAKFSDLDKLIAKGTVEVDSDGFAELWAVIVSDSVAATVEFSVTLPSGFTETNTNWTGSITGDASTLADETIDAVTYVDAADTVNMKRIVAWKWGDVELAADGTAKVGDVIAAAALSAPAKKVELTAVWADLYKVQYNSNKANGGADNKNAFDLVDPSDATQGANLFWVGDETLEIDDNTAANVSFAPAGDYTFSGWALTPTGDVVTEGGTKAYFTQAMANAASKNVVTLYAVWAQKGSPYTIMFDANATGLGTAKGSMDDLDVKVGDSVKLTSNDFTLKNYEFKGWNTVGNGSGLAVADGAAHTSLDAKGAADKSITLYAQWAKKYTVTYLPGDDPKGAKKTVDATGSVSDQAAVEGTSQDLKANGFKKEGFTFAGWVYDSDGDGIVDDGEPIVTTTKALEKAIASASHTITAGGEVKVYAKWLQGGKADPEPEPEPTPEVKAGWYKGVLSKEHDTQEAP